MKNQIVCIGRKYTSMNGEYAHWEVELIGLEYWQYGKEVTQSNTEIIRLSVQMDKEKGFSIWKSYGGRCESMNVNGGLKLAKKALSKISEVYGARGLAKISRMYPRYEYLSLTKSDQNEGFYGYVPRKHAKTPALWIKAMKAGYELKKSI